MIYNQSEMEKTFDQLLLEIGEVQNTEEFAIRVKVAIVKALAPNFLCSIQELANSYHWQELDEEELCTQVEQVINDTFCIGPEVGEIIDREFDFEEWVENAEGPPHDIPRCYNCGAPLQQENGALCYECEPENDED